METASEQVRPMDYFNLQTYLQNNGSLCLDHATPVS
jgi:hypothetical protein